MDIQPRFKLGKTTASKPADPAHVFRNLKPRSNAIKHPWSHQADLWKQYEQQYMKSSDVAFELPTGSGKTLVGLILAEYRRQKFDEKVVYLCPTRQLAKQVGMAATDCGINATVSLTPSYEGLTDYKLGKTVAITTYSSLFNINPKFENPDIIILDDAHSAENYISSMWSLNITRNDKPALYRQIIELFAKQLDSYSKDLLLNDDCSPNDKWYIHSIPISFVAENEKALRDLISASIKGDDSLKHSWSLLKTRLHACQIYVSWWELLLRPFIPPSKTHNPFRSAKQRIYMSATLGASGELERITGVPAIERMQRPEASNGESSGRRLFLFPETRLSTAQTESLLYLAIKEADRALVLVPTTKEADLLSEQLRVKGLSVIGAKDIEDDLSQFSQQKEIALVLANRYDGLDLPDDSCRLLILMGVPIGANLQERFLLSHLGIGAVLADRMRTRLTQGLGRCCRNSKDYAAVIVLGKELADFCYDRIVKKSLNKDIQAELRFGLEQDELKSESEYLGLIKLLLTNRQEWEGAENEIDRIKTELTELEAEETDLPNTVKDEVEFIYALWDKKFERAAQLASRVEEMLEKVKDAQTYRAWWLYLSGTTTWLQGKQTSDSTTLLKAKKQFARAADLCTGLTWFPELVHNIGASDLTSNPVDFESRRSCQLIYEKLKQLGFTGQKFENVLQEMLTRLGSTKSKEFELGLLTLGEFLGFTASRPTEEACPDGVWKHGSTFVISIEAKSDETPKDPVSYETIRQVSFQPNWIRKNLGVAEDTKIYSVLVTPRRTIKRQAHAEANDISVLHLDDVINLAQKLSASLRLVRAKGGAFAVDATITAIEESFRSDALLPSDICAKFRKKPLSSLKIVD